MGQEQCGCITADERRGMAVRGRAAAQHCRARIPSAGECGAEKGNQFYESGDKEKVVFSLACVTCPIAWRMEMAKCAGSQVLARLPKGGSQGGPSGPAGGSTKAPLTSSGNVAFPPSVGAPLCGPTLGPAVAFDPRPHCGDGKTLSVAAPVAFYLSYLRRAR